MKSFLQIVAALGVCIAAAQAVPWIAEPRTDQGWIDAHERFKANTAANAANINVLFYGDSITQGWGGNGKTVWATEYEPLGPANYGIGGDRTEHLLYRIPPETNSTALRPRLVVLKIGTNNGGNTEEDVVRGITAVVDSLKEHVPSANILLLGILPRSNCDCFKRIYNINIHISKLVDGDRVHFLNMFDQFASNWGETDPALFYDGLHLTTAGYQLWADTMRVAFNELFYGGSLLKFMRRG